MRRHLRLLFTLLYHPKEGQHSSTYSRSQIIELLHQTEEISDDHLGINHSLTTERRLDRPIYRGHPRLHQGQSLSAAGQTEQDPARPAKVQAATQCYRICSSAPTRPHGINHIHLALCQTQDEASTGLAYGQISPTRTPTIDEVEDNTVPTRRPAMEGSPDSYGQHHCSTLHKQTRWNPFTLPSQPDDRHMDLVLPETQPPLGDSHSLRGQYHGQPPKQDVHQRPRVDDNQASSGTLTRDPDCTLVALSALAPHPVESIVDLATPSTSSQPLITAPRSPSPSLSHPLSLEQVLGHARKQSTVTLYHHKWQAFLSFTCDHCLPTSPTSLDTLLRFLLLLFNRGLFISTLKVYIAAVVAHQPPDSEAADFFKHPTLKQFLQGARNLCPDRAPIPPQWSLNVVLKRLTRPPFEPLASVPLHMLSVKLAFLLAITSARRASELAALRSDPPFLQFHLEKVTLYPDVSFLLKVVSHFHLSQPLVLPTYFPSPSTDVERMLHTLDVRRALLFYTSRTAPIRRSPRLFIHVMGPAEGTPVTSQTISRWIVETIHLAYRLSGTPLPVTPKGHSTRAIASSSAFLKGVPLLDICRAATWSTPSTFAQHYKLDIRARAETAFGRAVLSYTLP
ncbi:hypothetical protein JRQ81_013277 [Phrynocephalus forsythii]|uniref:Tyr recombinase domain-containing protein n=1 Tax=Phrynocephalus forsythii TaxID=171643 RepID=A0A9Q0Y0T0_9SAUR|nr:hypothetical protein JRQ81_013277 [Phrynocephalus forsythii]